MRSPQVTIGTAGGQLTQASARILPTVSLTGRVSLDDSIASLIDSPAARSVLMSAIFLTIAVPVLIYLFRFCLRLFKPRLPIQQDRNGAEPSGQPNAAPEQPASAVDAAAKTAGTPGTSSKKRR